jgi:hypothetical protein
MRESQFWELIDFARTAGPRGEAASLYRLLMGFPAGEIVSFASVQYRKMYQLYKPDLQAAHFIIRGSLSPDAFEQFTSWMVMQGQQAFDQVRKNPSYLATILRRSDVARQKWDYSVLAGKAYLDKTKSEDFWTKLAVPAPPEIDMPSSRDLRDFQSRHPDLFKAFCNQKRISSLSVKRRRSSNVIQGKTNHSQDGDPRVDKILEGMVHFLKAGADPGYTKRHIDRCGTILNGLLGSLKRVSRSRRDEHILAAARKGVLALNRLNRACDGRLIETDQREDICALIHAEAKRAGLRSRQRDITESWREW